MLNTAQKQAVEIIDGSVRIIAGAGTGKTRVLAHRIENLIGKGVKPWQILALTFTNKAAHELKNRIKEHLAVQIMTFHSLAARLLRKYWNPDFKIVEPVSLRLRLGGGGVSSVTCNKLSGRLFTEVQSDIELTFDELFTTLLQLWRDRPDILKKCQSLFAYIMVDEYQDVNEAQIEILRQMTAQHQNICIVGDPDQTIYSWRGSVATSLRDFEMLFPNARTITLAQNYRNPPAILKGAEALIGHNPNRLPKKLEANKTDDAVICHWQAQSNAELGEIVRHILEQKLGSHSHMHMADALDSGRAEAAPGGGHGFYGFGDIAILYRTQEQGKRIAACISRYGYPYQMSAPESFWARQEVIKFLKEIGLLANLPTLLTGGAADALIFSLWLAKHLEIFLQNQKFSRAQIQNLQHLIPYAMAFDGLPINEAMQAMLDEIALNQEADNLASADRINLLTLHAAKGLEFPIVLIVGIEEGVLPHKKSDIEEERRLLYVGMTRATKELHLLNTIKNPSRFITEIGRNNLSSSELPQIQIRQLKRRAIKRAQMRMF